MIPRSAAAQLHDQTIAIIDDNVAVLASLKFAIEAHGFKVRTYSLPTAFLEDIAAQPACLVIDYNLPGMTGLELVVRLREAGNSIPVLLTTGFLAPDIAKAAAALDIECVILKPIELDDLLKFLLNFG